MEKCPNCGGNITPRFITVTPEVLYANGTRFGAVAEREMYHEALECHNATGGRREPSRPCGYYETRAIPADEIRNPRRNRRTKGK